MLSTSSSQFPHHFLTRTGLLLCAGVAVMAMSLASGKSVAGEKTLLDVRALNASESLVLDPGAFGSSAGQASLKSAPTTWSSRSNVRWNARWAPEGRYLV